METELHTGSRCGAYSNNIGGGLRNWQGKTTHSKNRERIWRATKKQIQMAKKFFKRHSDSWIARETQVKITMRRPFS